MFFRSSVSAYLRDIQTFSPYYLNLRNKQTNNHILVLLNLLSLVTSCRNLLLIVVCQSNQFATKSNTCIYAGLSHPIWPSNLAKKNIHFLSSVLISMTANYINSYPKNNFVRNGERSLNFPLYWINFTLHTLYIFQHPMHFFILFFYICYYTEDPLGVECSKNKNT
jgi:hypothetical protein